MKRQTRQFRTCAAVLAIVAAASAAQAASGQIYSGRTKLGEVWVYPSMFEQALTPLAPLTTRAVKGGLCPGIELGPNNVIHAYDIDAKLKAEANAAAQFAEQSSPPTVESVFEDVYYEVDHQTEAGKTGRFFFND